MAECVEVRAGCRGTIQGMPSACPLGRGPHELKSILPKLESCTIVAVKVGTPGNNKE